MKVSQAIYNRILALVALVFQTIPSVRVVIFTAQLAACSFGCRLMAGAGLLWEKSTTGWLVMVCSERKVLLAGV
jgi:hypothetical protein